MCTQDEPKEKAFTDTSSEDYPRDSAGWLIRPAPNSRARLTGDEQFQGAGGATVSEFWRFAMQDLQMNNTRGYLAEFLVGTALGIEASRVEWDPFDLLWQRTGSESVRIEVKSSAYLQSWRQRKLSTPMFSGLKGKVLDDDLGVYSAEAEFNADVYVMCLNEQRNPITFDPLDIRKWSFYVVPRLSIAASNLASVNLRWLDRQDCRPVTFEELKPEVEKVWKLERETVFTSVSTGDSEKTRKSTPFGVPTAFASVDDRAIAPCTSCGRASRYQAESLHVIRFPHGSTPTGHFDVYCPTHLAQRAGVSR